MDKPHTVRSFDKELEEYKNKLSEMGKAAGWQLAKAVKALMKRDERLAEEIIKTDSDINALEKEAENLAILLIATRQPLAGDLRNVIAGLKICTDLERIADYAANIAKNTIGMKGADLEEPMECIVEMGKTARIMLDDAIDALSGMDAEKAIDVWHRDDEIDRNFARMMLHLRRYMRESPESVDVCTHLIFIGRCCERIGDHITNLAENIHYMVTGETYIGSLDVPDAVAASA